MRFCKFMKILKMTLAFYENMLYPISNRSDCREQKHTFSIILFLL